MLTQQGSNHDVQDVYDGLGLFEDLTHTYHI